MPTEAEIAAAAAKKEAAAAKKEADAAKAAADAAKAAADTGKVQAEIDKLAAETRSARAKAAVDEVALADQSGTLGIKQRQAAAEAAIAESGQKTAAAQTAQIAALVPDLSKVDRGSLTMGDSDPPMFGAELGRVALKQAGLAVAGVVPKPEAKNSWVLVISDEQLVESDLAWHSVTAGLEQHVALAKNLREQRGGPAPETQDPVPAGARGVQNLAPVLGAAASALPAALSLLSAHRTVRSSATKGDDLAAAAATISALKARNPADSREGDKGATAHRWHVVHDQVRLLAREGDLNTKLSELQTERQKVESVKLELESEKARVDAQLTTLRGRIEDLKTALSKAEGADVARLTDRLKEAREEAEPAERDVQEADAKLARVTSGLAAVDSFVAAINLVPASGGRSPLEAALLRAVLHESSNTQVKDENKPGTPSHRISHVLLVKGNTGDVSTVVDDRPLWLADRFIAIATATITFMLVDADTNEVLASGTESGAAVAEGELGSSSDVSISPKAIG